MNSESFSRLFPTVRPKRWISRSNLLTKLLGNSGNRDLLQPRVLGSKYLESKDATNAYEMHSSCGARKMCFYLVFESISFFAEKNKGNTVIKCPLFGGCRDTARTQAGPYNYSVSSFSSKSVPLLYAPSGWRNDNHNLFCDFLNLNFRSFQRKKKLYLF